MMENKDSGPGSAYSQTKCSYVCQLYCQTHNPSLIKEVMEVEGLNQLVNIFAKVIFASLPQTNTLVDCDDLIQEGAKAVIKGLRDYNPDKGIKPRTFLHKRIKGSMLDLIRSLDPVSHYTRPLINEIEKKAKIVEHEHLRHVSLRVIAEEMGPRYVEAYERGDISYISIDDVFYSDGKEDGIKYQDIIMDKSPGQLDAIIKNERDRTVNKLVNGLPKKMRILLHLYYVEEFSMKEIGIIFRRSESWVSYLHLDAINMLREKLLELGIDSS